MLWALPYKAHSLMRTHVTIVEDTPLVSGRDGWSGGERSGTAFFASLFPGEDIGRVAVTLLILHSPPRVAMRTLRSGTGSQMPR